jgi:hypothetical protein
MHNYYSKNHRNELCTTISELCKHINNNAINLRTMQLNTGVVQQNDNARMAGCQYSQGFRRIIETSYRSYISYKLIID